MPGGGTPEKIKAELAEPAAVQKLAIDEATRIMSFFRDNVKNRGIQVHEVLGVRWTVADGRL